jgi:hypothetical protein
MFTAHASSWAKFLAPFITPELDKDLFVKVFMTLVSNKLKIEHYLKIRAYLDVAEYANLINSFKHAAEFLAKIYEADKHFDKIKNLIDSRSNIWNFDKLIKPLLNVYPHYCFRKIAAMTYETLNTERGRSIYEQIAKWLVLTKQLPGMQQDVMILIGKTYNHKPNLPALKDEMCKAMVV